MKTQPISVQQAIRRLMWAVLALYAILAVCGAAATLYVLNLAARGDQAYAAACAQKEQLQQNVLRTVEFLQDHPEGFAGLPAATLAVNVHNQARSVYTLQSVLDCGTPDLGPLPPLPGG